MTYWPFGSTWRPVSLHGAKNQHEVLRNVHPALADFLHMHSIGQEAAPSFGNTREQVVCGGSIGFCYKFETACLEEGLD